MKFPEKADGEGEEEWLGPYAKSCCAVAEDVFAVGDGECFAPLGELHCACYGDSKGYYAKKKENKKGVS